MFPRFKLLIAFLQLFKSLPSLAMPGIHSEGLKLRALSLHFKKPGRIFKLKQAPVNLIECMGQPPTMDRIGFRPGSNQCVGSVQYVTAKNLCGMCA